MSSSTMIDVDDFDEDVVIDTSPVKIIHKSLVVRKYNETKQLSKKPKIDNVCKTSIVKINNNFYYFNSNDVLEKEPNTNLFNPHCTIFNTKYNITSEVLEYLTPIKHFDIINDYLHGYNIHNLIDRINDNQLQKTINDLFITLEKFKMINLYDKIDSYFPIVMIESKIFMINIQKLNKLEPNNLLFEKANKVNDCKIRYIFRDLDIFKNYIYDYVNGVVYLNETVELIKECKETNLNLYNKIIEDIEYYGLKHLLQHI